MGRSFWPRFVEFVYCILLHHVLRGIWHLGLDLIYSFMGSFGLGRLACSASVEPSYFVITRHERDIFIFLHWVKLDAGASACELLGSSTAFTLLSGWLWLWLAGSLLLVLWREGGKKIDEIVARPSAYTIVIR